MMTMKKYFFTLLCLSVIGTLQAQVGINTTTPHSSAALDITSPGNNQGVLLPRMSTAQKLAIATPAKGLLVYDTDRKCISQNTGSESAPLWVCLMDLDTHVRSFYMPSIAIDASTLATSKSLDLYDEYKKQFGSPTASSAGAPVSIPYFPAATDLYYYITYYDNTVLKVNSISVSGVVNYDVILEADYNSFMNVVFVVK